MERRIGEPEEPAIARWLHIVERTAEHGDGAASHRDRSLVGDGVDPAGQSADDGQSFSGEDLGDSLGAPKPSLGGIARADDGDARPMHEKIPSPSEVDPRGSIPPLEFRQRAEEFFCEDSVANEVGIGHRRFPPSLLLLRVRPQPLPIDC